MKSLKLLLLLVTLFAATKSMAGDANPCPNGDYSGLRIKFVEYVEETGYIVFSVESRERALEGNTPYWLAKDGMNNPRARMNFTLALSAMIASKDVWLQCDGTQVTGIFVYY